MKTHTLATVGALAMTAGCMSFGGSGPRAIATLEPRSGSTVTGTVEFRQHGDHVRAVIDIAGLTPKSEHGFHIHEKGDCSAPDGASAGGHFNPSGSSHGRAGKGSHHGGDMPSLVADASGRVHTSFDLDIVTVDAGSNSIVGRSVVVHGGVDDYNTQPSGNSGPRVACGVIGMR